VTVGKRFLTLVVPIAGVLMAFTACSSSDQLGTRFERLAEDHGYRCHPTIPPTESVDVMLTCRGGDSADLVFVMFPSEDMRKRGEAQFLSVGAGQSRGRWIVSGSDTTDIDRIAEELED
jgi:hypothetical protein